MISQLDGMWTDTDGTPTSIWECGTASTTADGMTLGITAASTTLGTIADGMTLGTMEDGTTLGTMDTATEDGTIRSTDICTHAIADGTGDGLLITTTIMTTIIISR